MDCGKLALGEGDKIIINKLAGVAELADAQDLGSCGLYAREGSTPSTRTKDRRFA